jgi:hypothetical protein
MLSTQISDRVRDAMAANGLQKKQRGDHRKRDYFALG